ncbi:MAG: acyl--CoA ligase [Lachnospiraceae bacterium]|nr:acyl--CoA ligase [Lachnospiraceae bacterium]
MMTFAERIKESIKDREYVCDARDGSRLTYREVWKRALSLSADLKRKESDSFVVIMENGLDLFLLYHAAMLSNMTIIPIDPQKSQAEIDHILSENPGKPVIRSLEDISGEMRDMSDDELFAAIDRIDMEKDYMVTYTSGSTGFPKGVRHRLQSLLHAGDSFGEAVGLGPDDSMCHVMPMTYMAGILNTILMPMIRGSRIVIMPRFDVMSAIRFWKTAETYGVNSFWLSPTMLNILMTVDRRGEGRKYLSGTDTKFFIGTAPLFETLRSRFEAMYDVKLLQSYGLSETLFLSTEIPGKDSPASSVGYLLPEVDLRLSDDGEILIGVPWMFRGYTNDDTDSYFIGDYYKTGDLGKCENGIMSITGRLKDLIIKGGMNISPKLIEDCMLKNTEVDECAVAGVTVDDEERIICWYSCPDERVPDEPSVNRAIEKELGKHCCVDIFERIASIPKNINGKADKKKLVREYGT